MLTTGDVVMTPDGREGVAVDFLDTYVKVQFADGTSAGHEEDTLTFVRKGGEIR